MLSRFKFWFINFINEISINKGIKSKVVIALFRLSSLRYLENKIAKLIFFPIHVFYFVLVDFIMGVEIKAKTKIGWGLIIYHPVGIIINAESIIGSNCILRHNVTIGNKFNRKLNLETRSPIVGDNVEFGANSTVIGAIVIGDNVVIGANVFLDFDVENSKIVLPLRGNVLNR